MAGTAAAGAAGKSGFLSGLGGLGGAISAGSSIIGAISGLFQKGKANRMLKRLKDPGYNIPKEFAQNLAISESMAKEGMAAEQYNKGQQDINRAGTAGIRAISRSSNPSAGAASLLRGQTDALNNLNVANASARRQNILGAMGARRELAGQKLAQQQYAQQKYMDQVNQANALKGAGMQNVAGGLSSLGQVGLYQSIYGKGNNPTPATADTPATASTPTTPNSSTFNISDPYGLNQLFNQYQGVGGIVGKKFGKN